VIFLVVLNVFVEAVGVTSWATRRVARLPSVNELPKVAIRCEVASKTMSASIGVAFA